MRLPILFSVALSLVPLPALGADFDTLFPNAAPTEYAEVDEIMRTLDYKQGEIALPGGQIKLNIPAEYYYLDAEDASTVLKDLWGNPFGSQLGMILPSAYTPWDERAWGADMTFEAIGFVSDEDAAEIDYTQLMKDMIRDTKTASKERVEMGYDAMTMLGWADPPHYDADARQLHWAVELNFAGSPNNTLNYELRSLGREGVLSTVFVASMNQLDEVKAALPDVADTVSFMPGKTYADFDPSIDTVAAVGLAGLITGKVASKAGLLAAALVFLKKGWIVLLLPLLWLKNVIFRPRTS